VESNLDDHRPGLKPPRFSLATLFVAIAILGVLFAAMNYLGTYATLLFILFTLAVAAHVAGNALGTQLRANGDRPPIVSDDSARRRRDPIATADFAPPSQLRQRSALGKPIFISTVVGSAAGAVLGGYGLTMLMEHPTVITIALGVLASSVLGGIWTFGASSFLQVASSALRQAARDSKH
jgi:hypothetical protein